MKIKILISFLMVVMVSSSYSQRRRTSYSTPVKQKEASAIPGEAIDTVEAGANGQMIILYSNGSWKYYNPQLASLSELETVFSNHWDTTQIFAYKDIAFSDLPPIVELNIINTLKDFHTPTYGRISSKYGLRRYRNHNGTDIAAPLGTPLYATFNGKIRYAKYQTGGYGYLVIIRHNNGLESWYGHLCRLNVDVNDYVKAGQIIGYMGNTGRSRGNHLHYELRYQDQSFDPEFLIDFETGNLRYTTFALEKQFFNINSRASEILEEEDDEFMSSSNMFAAASDSTTLNNIIKNGTTEEKPAKATISQASGDVLYHTIKSGDILSKLAIRYGVTVKKICQLNNMSEKATLKLGQKLRIR